MNNIKQTLSAMIVYAQEDTVSQFPYLTSTYAPTGHAGAGQAGSLRILSDELRDPGVLMDPSSGRAVSTNWDDGCHCDFIYMPYGLPPIPYFTLSNTQPDSGIIGLRNNVHINFGAIGYCDGHVDQLFGSGWYGDNNVRNSNLSNNIPLLSVLP